MPTDPAVNPQRAPDAVVREADALLAEERWAEHLALLEAAARRVPDHPQVRLHFALSRLTANPPATAAELERAVELAPDDPALLVRAAHAMLGSGDSQKAWDWLQRAEALAPPEFAWRAQLHALIARFYASWGEDARAEKLLRMAHRENPEAELPIEYLALFLADRGRTDEALELLDGELDAKPSLLPVRAKVRQKALDAGC